MPGPMLGATVSRCVCQGHTNSCCLAGKCKAPTLASPAHLPYLPRGPVSHMPSQERMILNVTRAIQVVAACCAAAKSTVARTPDAHLQAQWLTCWHLPASSSGSTVAPAGNVAGMWVLWVCSPAGWLQAPAVLHHPARCNMAGGMCSMAGISGWFGAWLARWFAGGLAGIPGELSRAARSSILHAPSARSWPLGSLPGCLWCSML
jgi:hypothetical protein